MWKREYGDKERRVKYWARLGCCISPCYSPFWLGARFYGLFISLISLTLNLLTTTIVAPPSNPSKWQMRFNSVFKGLNFQFFFRAAANRGPPVYIFCNCKYYGIPYYIIVLHLPKLTSCKMAR